MNKMKSMVKQTMSVNTTLPVPHGSQALNRRTLLLGAVAFCLGSTAQGQFGPNKDVVSLETARAEHEAGRVLMIDIREPNETATGVARGVKLLPMSQMGGRLAEIPRDGKRPVLLICHSQNRSKAALKSLRELGGYEHVRYVEGGMSGWARRGWPMVAPPR